MKNQLSTSSSIAVAMAALGLPIICGTAYTFGSRLATMPQVIIATAAVVLYFAGILFFLASEGHFLKKIKAWGPIGSPERRVQCYQHAKVMFFSAAGVLTLALSFTPRG